MDQSNPTNLEEVEYLHTQIIVKVAELGACHVIDKHKTIPLGLYATKESTINNLNLSTNLKH